MSRLPGSAFTVSVCDTIRFPSLSLSLLSWRNVLSSSFSLSVPSWLCEVLFGISGARRGSPSRRAGLTHRIVALLSGVYPGENPVVSSILSSSSP